MSLDFEILSSIYNIELIARGVRLRDRRRLRRTYGPGHWRKLKGNARIKFLDGAICVAELHWYEAHGIGRRAKAEKSSAPSMNLTNGSRFVICLDNRGTPASLEVGKVYRALRPEKNARELKLIRVVDESGEDYLYPARQFATVRLPEAAKQALLRRAAT